MADIVTYLLGAGASANAIPTVSEFSTALHRVQLSLQSAHDFRNRVYQVHDFHEGIFSGGMGYRDDDTFLMRDMPFEYEKYYNLLMGDLEWLRMEQRNHRSVDTLAKKLFLTKSYEIRRCKRAIMFAFLIFELSHLVIEPNYQTVTDYLRVFEETEGRYDSFYAALLERGEGEMPSLPRNVRVLSWNYDMQMERCFMKYAPTINELNALRQKMNVVDRPRGRVGDPGNFSLVKLNGTATDLLDGAPGIGTSAITRIHNYCTNYGSRIYYFPKGNSWVQDIERVVAMLQFHMHIIRAYKYLYELDESQLNLRFAWETVDDPNNAILNVARRIAKETTILVVVGYSFPIFNRVIDQKIIGALDITKGTLRKVVIQAPTQDSLNGMAEALQAIRPEIGNSIALEKREDCSQFYIPHELVV